jgi:transcriptional regulator with XRE-family HTH domain
MGRATYVHITPKVLAWAIQESGYEAGEVADRLKIAPQTLAAWMAGREQPTLTGFRKITALLKRPEATFFLPAPPRRVCPRWSSGILPT